jgi:Cu/Ag efflux pump CusA
MAPSPYPLRTYLGSVQENMLNDFRYATAQIEHRPSKGREREAMVVSKFLNWYLPSKVKAINGAEILDSVGGRSRETDIVIQDASTPSVCWPHPVPAYSRRMGSWSS